MEIDATIIINKLLARLSRAELEASQMEAYSETLQEVSETLQEKVAALELELAKLTSPPVAKPQRAQPPSEG